ncbi:uncharacterized protein C5orf52 homolog [Saccopteryx leptura]|uniref:uncharacterized protein C5orf52 homolog n=1 Tax=Saccopteryx leptura TaxID=249018 RepID=UPI00339D0B78
MEKGVAESFLEASIRGTIAPPEDKCREAEGLQGLTPSNLALVSESFPSMENATTQQRRSSVARDLSSPIASTAANKTTTSSGTYPTSAVFPRQKRRNLQDINSGTRPQIRIVRPQTAQPLVLLSLMNSSEVAVSKYLPKSHLSRVIFHDNLRIQRIYEMQVKALEKTKKKVIRYYDHLEKKFMMDQLRKLERWKRESAGVRQYLNSIRAHKVLPSNKKSQPS